MIPFKVYYITLKGKSNTYSKHESTKNKNLRASEFLLLEINLLWGKLLWSRVVDVITASGTWRLAAEPSENTTPMETMVAATQLGDDLLTKILKTDGTIWLCCYSLTFRIIVVQVYAVVEICFFDRFNLSFNHKATSFALFHGVFADLRKNGRFNPGGYDCLGQGVRHVTSASFFFPKKTRWDLESNSWGSCDYLFYQIFLTDATIPRKDPFNFTDPYGEWTWSFGINGTRLWVVVYRSCSWGDPVHDRSFVRNPKLWNLLISLLICFSLLCCCVPLISDRSFNIYRKPRVSKKRKYD